MSLDTTPSGLFLDLYELTMAQSYFCYKREARATFEVFVRQLPQHRNYLIACGTADVVRYLSDLSFSKEDVAYLRSLALFSDDFLLFLRRLHFTGDVWAMPEGTAFFAQEPILRVTAPLIEAQLIESAVLNILNLQTMIASKASRVVAAAGLRPVFDFSLRRTQGYDAAMKVARSSYIAGCRGTSNVRAGKDYGIPVVGTMAHSFVMAFNHELDSFIAYSNMFPGETILLIDTYDPYQGIRNAIAIGNALKKKGFALQGIRIDSGDIVTLSRWARTALDNSGLAQTKIVASGNLDEYKIKYLLNKGACVDSFGVGTHMGASVDAPSIDVIYKLVEVTNDQGRFLPTMKLSSDKVTYPGRKQVFRKLNSSGEYVKDIVALDDEPMRGTLPLIHPLMRKGRYCALSRTLPKVRSDMSGSLKRFSKTVRSIDKDVQYPVEISPALQKLQKTLSMQLKQRQ